MEVVKCKALFLLIKCLLMSGFEEKNFRKQINSQVQHISEKNELRLFSHLLVFWETTEQV